MIGLLKALWAKPWARWALLVPIVGWIVRWITRPNPVTPAGPQSMTPAQGNAEIRQIENQAEAARGEIHKAADAAQDRLAQKFGGQNAIDKHPNSG